MTRVAKITTEKSFSAPTLMSRPFSDSRRAIAAFTSAASFAVLTAYTRELGSASGLDTPRLEGFQSETGGFDLCPRLIDGCLQLGLLGRPSATLEQIQPCLRSFDRRIRRVDRPAGSGSGSAARGATAR